MRRAGEAPAHAVLRWSTPTCLPQTARGAGHPGRAARHRARRRRPHRPEPERPCRDGELSSGCSLQYPGASGRGGRPAPVWSRPAHERGALVAVARRPAGADACSPRPASGRRRRGRQHPAVRRADGLRRPARRLPGGPRRAAAAAARPAGRGLGGRRRPPGLPARPADPRAAHPPGEGDQQHLHRPGAARGDGRDVRRLPRRRRAGGDRRAGCTGRRPRWPTRCGPAASRCVHDAFFDTVLARVPGAGRRPVQRPRRERGLQRCAWSTPTRGGRPATRPPRPSTWPRCCAAFGVSRRPAR